MKFVSLKTYITRVSARFLKVEDFCDNLVEQINYRESIFRLFHDRRSPDSKPLRFAFDADFLRTFVGEE